MSKTKIDILLRNIDRQDWQYFQGYCRFEGVSATAKMRKIIADYVKSQEKESKLCTG